jgi:transcriptional regulator with XRE-family HTH domain
MISYHLDLVRLGARVAQRRRQLGLTQRDLALRAAKSELYIHRLERGRVGSPKVHDLAAVTGALGVTIAMLFFDAFEDAERLAAALLAEEPDLGQNLARLLRGVARAGAADQIFIRAQFAALAERFGEPTRTGSSP